MISLIYNNRCFVPDILPDGSFEVNRVEIFEGEEPEFYYHNDSSPILFNWENYEDRFILLCSLKPSELEPLRLTLSNYYPILNNSGTPLIFKYKNSKFTNIFTDEVLDELPLTHKMYLVMVSETLFSEDIDI